MTTEASIAVSAEPPQSVMDEVGGHPAPAGDRAVAGRNGAGADGAAGTVPIDAVADPDTDGAGSGGGVRPDGATRLPGPDADGAVIDGRPGAEADGTAEAVRADADDSAPQPVPPDGIPEAVQADADGSAPQPVPPDGGAPGPASSNGSSPESGSSDGTVTDDAPGSVAQVGSPDGDGQRAEDPRPAGGTAVEDVPEAARDEPARDEPARDEPARDEPAQDQSAPDEAARTAVAERLDAVVGDAAVGPGQFAAAAVLDVLREAGWADVAEAAELRAEAERLRELLNMVVRDHRAREASAASNAAHHQELTWLVPLLRAAHGVAFGSLGAKVALRTAVQEVPPEVLAQAGLRIDYGVEPAYEDEPQQ